MDELHTRLVKETLLWQRVVKLLIYKYFKVLYKIIKYE